MMRLDDMSCKMAHQKCGSKHPQKFGLQKAQQNFGSKHKIMMLGVEIEGILVMLNDS